MEVSLTRYSVLTFCYGRSKNSKLGVQSRKFQMCSRRFPDAEERNSPNETFELGREVAKLLDCTTWTGAGPGLMDAAVKGALAAKKPVGGFKIGREAGEWTSSNFHPYLPVDNYLTCRFFSARKHGLVDAAMRNSSEMTAVVGLPGGVGTLDEIFEFLSLIQLGRTGSRFPVPFLLMNYDSYYSKLLDFIADCETWGTLDRGEVDSIWKVCDSNLQALEYLVDFYKQPSPKSRFWEN